MATTTDKINYNNFIVSLHKLPEKTRREIIVTLRDEYYRIIYDVLCIEVDEEDKEIPKLQIIKQ